jgi:hypothetical protein
MQGYNSSGVNLHTTIWIPSKRKSSVLVHFFGFKGTDALLAGAFFLVYPVFSKTVTQAGARPARQGPR